MGCRGAAPFRRDPRREPTWNNQITPLKFPSPARWSATLGPSSRFSRLKSTSSAFKPVKEVDTLAVCPLQPLSPPSWTKPEETNSLLLGRPMLVVSTGALYDGRGLAANPGWDVQAVWVGTRFVAYEEVGAPPMYKKAIMDTGHEDFVRTLIYTRRPLRVIRSPKMTSRSTPKNPTVPGHG